MGTEVLDGDPAGRQPSSAGSFVAACLLVRQRRALRKLCQERPVACFGDLQSFYFERLPPFADHALSDRGDESEAHQLCQLVGLEAVHAHDPFGAAFRAATDEQRKRAALIGLWAARWSRARHFPAHLNPMPATW